MQVSVNLATKPFVELRPLYARLRLAIIVMALVAVALFFAMRVLDHKAEVAQAAMNNLKAQTLKYQQEQKKNEARMQEPQNQAVLYRSQFLNDVFARKSFSWTAVMMELERVLPAGVMVTNIEPNVSKEGDVSIRMRISGDRDQGVQLLKNLELSERFLSPMLTTESSQQEQHGHSAATVPTAPGAVEFEIMSGYNKLPEASAKQAKAGSDSADGKAAQKDKAVQKDATPKAPKNAPAKAAPKTPVTAPAKAAPKTPVKASPAKAAPPLKPQPAKAAPALPARAAVPQPQQKPGGAR
ncbi:MAG: fimbrial assembly protein [Acidobacteriaceae bacterium]|nr:fimbrial assembly protein [Acidobacteriaceae bacterium]